MKMKEVQGNERINGMNHLKRIKQKAKDSEG